MNFINHPDTGRAYELAKQYYDTKTFEHAIRVAMYVRSNEFLQERYRIDCICLALMHDLLEDTSYSNDTMFECELGTLSKHHFNQALQLLTKPEDMDYISYIKRLKTPSDTIRIDARYCAWVVKMADMKDHLAQVGTLTDKLKDKYLEALPYLL